MSDSNEIEVRTVTAEIIQYEIFERTQTNQALALTEKIDKVNELISSSADLAQGVGEIFKSIVAFQKIRMDFEYALKRLNVEREYLLRKAEIDSDSKIEKLREILPFLKPELSKISERVDKILDEALANHYLVNETDRKHKSDLMKLAQEFSHKIHEILMAIIRV